MTTTTYASYAGEFSSDDDFETNQRTASSQQSKWNKFDSDDKASPEAIEAAIESLKSVPLDEDFELSDELIAGCLDHYKAKRGPIVDSTRRLYKKILLKFIKEETEAKDNGSKDLNNELDNQRAPTEQLNGKSISSSNQSNEQFANKRQYQKATVNDVYSSDEDDLLGNDPPEFYSSYDANATVQEAPMDIDSAENTPQFRSTKLVESSTDSETEEDNDERDDDDDDEDTQEDHDELESKVSDKNQFENATRASAGMSSSTPISKASRLRKLAGTNHSKDDSFEKPTATRGVTFKRRPTTRSQRAPNSSSSSLDDNQASSSTLIKTDTVSAPSLYQRSRPLRKVITIFLILYIMYYFYKALISKNRETAKGFRSRLPNIQF